MTIIVIVLLIIKVMVLVVVIVVVIVMAILLAQFCPREKGVIRPYVQHQPGPNHNTGNSVPYSLR